MAEAEAAPSEPAAVAEVAATTEAPTTWTDGLNEDAQGYIENKGWKSPDQMLSSYKSLEKVSGVPADQIMRLPQEADDAEGWSDVYSKLGRPETAEGYELEAGDVPEGGFDLTPDLREWAHEAGLSQQQAQALHGKYNARLGEMAGEMAAQREEQATADEQDLRKEWGAAWDENIQAGVRFRERFGLNDETVNKLESALGLRGLLELSSKIGKGLGEQVMPGEPAATSGSEFGLSPAGARAKIDELMSDSSFSQKYMAGDAPAVSRMTRLHSLAHPEVAKPA